jgi:hypothetical protein
MGFQRSRLEKKSFKVLFIPQNPMSKEAPSWDVAYQKEKHHQKHSDPIGRLRSIKLVSHLLL